MQLPIGMLSQLPLWRKVLLALAANVSLRQLRRRVNRSNKMNSAKRRSALADCRNLVELVDARELGGERLDSGTFCRFLSVVEWDAKRAAELLKRDIKWRSKYRPRLLRPADMPTMRRQGAWQVQMRPMGAPRGALSSLVSSPSFAVESARSARWNKLRSSWLTNTSLKWSSRGPLHPPHHRPPLQQWRYTRSGMPVTCFFCEHWRPDRASFDERVRQVAYHVRARAPT